MHIPDFTSFRLRLLIGVFVPVFVIQCLGILIDTIHLRDAYRRAQETEAALMTSLAGNTLVLPMWDFDRVKVRSILDGLIREGSAGRVTLLGPDHAVWEERRADGFSPDADRIRSVQPLVYVDGDQAVPLGELIVEVPTGDVFPELASAGSRTLTTSVLILALITASVHLVLSRLARPLAALSATIVDLQNGRLSGPIPGEERSDEIGLVAKAVDQLRRNEIEMSRLRAKNDEQTRREGWRIRRALDTTRDGILLANEKGRVVYCNPTGSRFFGGATVGAKLQFRSWLAPAVALDFERACASRGSLDLDTLVEHHVTGETLNILLRAAPVLDTDGTYLGMVLLATDHTEQARQASRAKYLSEHDSLTGLPNRRLMEETLDQWVLKENLDTSILLADLDHFKMINDTLGHPVGDDLLRHVAKMFQQHARANQLAARLGGDEFALLAMGPDSQQALVEVAEVLVQEMAQPQHVGERELHTGMSIGIATVLGSEVNASDGIRRADLALYEAKRGGRGRVELFHKGLESTIHRKTLLDRELRRALGTDEIFPVYQMQTDLKTGEVIGFETLARWKHPEFGFVSPAEFIPIAEESGLIRELTYRILSQACAAAARWHADGFKGRVAVNISPKLFGTGVQEFINDCLFEQNCPAETIEVEITETVVLSNGGTTLPEIEALQGLGLTVALDDFGMGYSSLSYLQKFPVDKIKIDREFVEKLPESAETRAIVVAITELGHALGMQVTGEGAETEEHRSALRDCEVDYLQGYVDGTPMSVQDASALVQSQLTRRRQVS